jgi:hypothetical protein
VKAPQVWPAIEHAMASPELKAEAQRRWAAIAPNLFFDHDVELSASSAGRCALEVWAYLHDKLTLPENYATELCKMDGGTLYGARAAALFAAGFEDLHPEYAVSVELQVEHDGIPGHLDIRITEITSGQTWWVIEVKATFSTFAFDDPPDYHKIQVAKYGLAEKAPGISVFTILPAAQRRNGAPAKHFHQWDGVTAHWEGDVDQEYARLKRATRDTPPQADPKEGWRCGFCRYGACSQNPRHNASAEMEIA